MYSDAQRKQISEMAKGKVIESMEWEPQGRYWVITFTGGEELCVRLMAEIGNRKAKGEQS